MGYSNLCHPRHSNFDWALCLLSLLESSKLALGHLVRLLEYSDANLELPKIDLQNYLCACANHLASLLGVPTRSAGEILRMLGRF